MRLIAKFKVVVMSKLPQARISKVLSFFESKSVVFDAVYLRPIFIQNDELFTSYKKIFDDFNIQKEDVKWQVLLVWPILLENAELKLRCGEELIFDTLVNKKKQFHVRGLSDPKDKLDSPVTILVPHFLSQIENKSMWFSNVVTFIESLYIASATDSDNKVGSPIRKKPAYKVTTKQYSHEDVLQREQQKPRFFVMKTIAIAPQNHFKKIQKRVYDKNLDVNNTSWVHGFNSCLKYELFSAKVIMTHEPRLYQESKGEQLEKLNTR